MGEMADFALEEVMDAEDYRLNYRIGRMSDAQAYELGIIDELGGYNHPPMFSPKTTKNRRCRYCKKRGLQWAVVETGWRLIERNGTVHSCEQYFTNPVDNF